MSSQRLTRRDALVQSLGLAAAALASSAARADDAPPRSQLGLVSYCCNWRRKFLEVHDAEDLFEPQRLVRLALAFNVGGVQTHFGTLTAPQIRELRELAEEHAFYLEGMVDPPRNEADCSRFEAEMRTAAELGVLAVRTVVMPGRRYEQFQSLAEFREAEVRARAMLELAAPIVTKLRVRLAVENHKDQRIDERLALLRHLNCEFIGSCVDTGNSLALLEDPYEVITALAPYAFSVHLKDQALQEYDEGYLLADVPLGEGAFDLPRMVDTLRKAQPKVRFSLELITRDALRVPCVTTRYWTTMPTVPGTDLARTLRLVRERKAETMPAVSGLALDRQVVLEDNNRIASVKYARERLGL